MQKIIGAGILKKNNPSGAILKKEAGTMEQKFCPYCGKPLEEDQPCRCEGAKQAAREAAQQPWRPDETWG